MGAHPKGEYQRAASFDTSEESQCLPRTSGSDSDTVVGDALPRNPSRRRRWLPALFHGILLTFYTTLFVIAVSLSQRPPCSNSQGPNLIHSPARDAVFYEKVQHYNQLNATSIYMGDPRPELNDAWEHLLTPEMIRVSRNDLDKIGKDSIPIQDEEGGYLANLEVFHQLHCLRALRMFMAKDYYPGSAFLWRKTHGEVIPFHLDHCINGLRQYLMCHADVSLNTYNWIEDYKKPWGDWDVQHECRNWDSIYQWSTDHHVDISTSLVHPKWGPVQWDVPG
ncbi:oxidase UstYa family protein [Microdochium nivale]|nr:oxidase UstYa family protein [Microdochium nivale]